MPGSWLNPIANEHTYDPDKQVPDLSSKVILITGGNAGIGLTSAIELAKHNPRKLYITARTRAKYDAAPTANLEFLELDLASLANVKRAADRFLADNDRLDILINNAGVMGVPPSTTAEGYEIHFGTNHVGHALLTKLLLPLLLATAATPGSDVRIVNVSSEAHSAAPGTGFAPDTYKRPGGDGARMFFSYGISKMANTMHARELAKHYPSILCVAVHPGRVQTELLAGMFERGGAGKWIQKTFDALAGPLTAREGGIGLVWCASWKREELVNGAYYVPWGKLKSVPKADNAEVTKQLWDWTEEELKSHGY